MNIIDLHTHIEFMLIIFIPLIGYLTSASEEPMNIIIGQPLSITCNLTNITGDNSKVEWIKYGEEDNTLKEDATNRYKIFENNATLVITIADSEDAGTYECRTTGQQSYSENFTVIYFNLKKLPKSTIVTEGDVIKLNCLASGKPIPAVQWLKGGQKLNDSRYEYAANEESTANAVLTLKNVQQDDRGLYLCQVFSEIGVYNTSTYLTVRMKGESKYIPIDWSLIQETKTSVESLASIQENIKLGSCPCDLSAQMCDIYCCCDLDCSSHDKAAFECLDGLKGGELTIRHEDNYCNFYGPYSPEWHRFLCLKYDNNPYIGHFFSIFPIIENIEEYVSKIITPKYSYEENDGEIQGIHLDSKYVIGSEIEIIHDDNQLLKRYLSLPQTSLYAYCIDSYPIKFLLEFSHVCPFSLTANTCVNDERLDLNYYLKSSDKIPSFSKQNFKSNSSDSQYTNVAVQYLCENDIGNFIKFQVLDREKSNVYSSMKELSIADCSEVEGRQPVYNKTYNICENVVLDVQYTIYWSGSSIDSLLAKVTIGNVPVSINEPEKNNMVKKLKQLKKESLKITLLQNFNVHFSYVGSTNKSIDNISINLEDNSTLEDDVYTSEDELNTTILQRSGGPGYLIQKPLIAGYTKYTNFTQNSELDTEAEYTLEFEDFENNSTKEDNNISLSYELFNKSLENNTYSEENNESVHLNNYSDNSTLFYKEINKDRTSKKFQYVHFPDDSGLFTVKQVSDGECKNSNIEPIIFGVDTISGCKFNFQLQNDSSCSQINADLTEFLQSFVRADTLSKKGWPNATQEQDFITILVANKYDKHSPENGCNIPMQLEYTFVYQDVYLADDSKYHVPIFQIMAASVRILHSWYHYKNFPSHVQLTMSSTFVEYHKPSQISRFWLTQQDPWCSGGICWREILHPWTQPAYSHIQGDIADSLVWNSERNAHEVRSLGIHYFLENTTKLVHVFSNSILIILLIIPFLLLTLKQHYRIKL